MKNASVKKLSVLGVVLIAASTVTAAIFNSKGKKENKDSMAGQLIQSTGGEASGITCINGGSGIQCDYTSTGNASGESSTSRTNSNNEPNEDHSTTSGKGLTTTTTNTTVYK